MPTTLLHACAELNSSPLLSKDRSAHNLQGEVIGISNLKAIAGDGVSFAIPIDTAKGVISQLLQPSGRVARPYIGCKTLELNSRCGHVTCTASPPSCCSCSRRT
jgi:hypothetical protein